MIYECAYCNKLYDGDEGIMVLTETSAFFGVNHIYAFKCKNCMTKELREKFEQFKKKK